VAAALIGKRLCRDTLTAALSAVSADVAISDTAPGGKVEYRRALAESFLFKFYVHVCNQLEEAEVSAAVWLTYLLTCLLQVHLDKGWVCFSSNVKECAALCFDAQPWAGGICGQLMTQ
jgi:hypothetical protein